MIRRGRLQYRGRIRWKLRRAWNWVRTGPSRVRALPVVFGNAIPKSGSKLLFNILRGLPKIAPFVETGLNEIKPYEDGAPTPQEWINRQLDALSPGDVRFGYLYAQAESLDRLCRPGWAPFMMIRDPRDTVVSEIFYALAIHTGHALHDFLERLPDMEARIAALVGGIPSGPLQRVSVRGQFDRFLPWLDRSEVCAVRFEDLIGEPERELDRILAHVERPGIRLKVSREHAREILKAGMAPAKSATFREGRAQGWRQHFTPANKAQFKRVAGDLLLRLGYESGVDW